MTSIAINIHSFSDLVTNSSSETYVVASQATITAVKKVAAEFMKTLGSTEKVDDVLEFHIGHEYVFESYTDEGGFQFSDERKVLSSKEEAKEYASKLAKKHKVSLDTVEYYKIHDGSRGVLLVTAKDKKYKNVAKLLSHLTDTFVAQEVYC